LCAEDSLVPLPGEAVGACIIIAADQGLRDIDDLLLESR
jgi:hypothetical protein